MTYRLYNIYYGIYTRAYFFTEFVRFLPGSEGKFIFPCVMMSPRLHIFISS